MDDDRLDFLLATLAHAGRRRMIDLLMATPGMSVKELASHFDMTRIAVLKHVRVLEQAELVLSRKVGRTRQLFFNAVPIQLIHDRWTDQYSAFWAERVADIKARIEGSTSDARSRKSA